MPTSEPRGSIEGELHTFSGRPPLLGARVHLDGGLRYEQAGLSQRAIAAYEAALGTATDPADLVEAHLRLARVYRSICRWDDACGEAREAVRLATELNNFDMAAEAMNVEVGVWQLKGDFRAAEQLARTALERVKSPRVRGILLQNLGAIAAQQRQFAEAEQLFKASVSEFEAAEYTLGIGIALNNASAAARDGGDAQRALELGARAEGVARQVDALDVLVLAVQNQAHALVALGELDAAEVLLGEALGHFSATHNELRQAECLEIMGHLHELKTNRETALRCYERALALATSVSDTVLADRVNGRLTELH